MTIEQTVEIPASRRLTLDLPHEIPEGKAKASLTLTFEFGKSAPKSKLSERFSGALRLSDKDYQAFQNDIQEGRNEWAKN